MIDIVGFDSKGMQIYDTQTQQAANILSVQLGVLEYEPTLGIDLKYFLTEKINFQDDSFKAYLVQTLASYGINVSSLIEVMKALDSDYNINLSPVDNSTGLITR